MAQSQAYLLYSPAIKVDKFPGDSSPPNSPSDRKYDDINGCSANIASTNSATYLPENRYFSFNFLCFKYPSGIITPVFLFFSSTIAFSATNSPPNSGSGSIPAHNGTQSEGSFARPSQSLIDEDYDEEPVSHTSNTRPPDGDSQTLASWSETPFNQQSLAPISSLATISQDSAIVDSLTVPSPIGIPPLPPPDPQYALYLDRIRELRTPLASLLPPDMAHLSFSDVFPNFPLDGEDVDEDGANAREAEKEPEIGDLDDVVAADRARPPRVRPVLCWTRLASDPPYKPEFWRRPTDEPISTLSSGAHIPIPPTAELRPDSQLGERPESSEADADEFGPLDQFKLPVYMGRPAQPQETYGEHSLLFQAFHLIVSYDCSL